MNDFENSLRSSIRNNVHDPLGDSLQRQVTELRNSLIEEADERVKTSYRQGFIDGSNRAAQRIGYEIQKMASPHFPEETE